MEVKETKTVRREGEKGMEGKGRDRNVRERKE